MKKRFAINIWANGLSVTMLVAEDSGNYFSRLFSNLGCRLNSSSLSFGEVSPFPRGPLYPPCITWSASLTPNSLHPYGGGPAVFSLMALFTTCHYYICSLYVPDYLLGQNGKFQEAGPCLSCSPLSALVLVR